VTFDEAVNAVMERIGCSRDRAELIVRANPHTFDAPPSTEPAKDASILEQREQLEIYKLFRAYGFKVKNLSQARASKQAPGLGDAWILHRDRPIAFWWESKRQVGGELSPAQIEMRDDCWRCGVRYYSGDRYAAADLLVQLGLAEAGNGPCGIVPIRQSA
jgi:hypothetical protein